MNLDQWAGLISAIVGGTIIFLTGLFSLLKILFSSKTKVGKYVRDAEKRMKQGNGDSPEEKDK
jgi:F0F1-type ATP synthase assembly protein I